MLACLLLLGAQFQDLEQSAEGVLLHPCGPTEVRNHPPVLSDLLWYGVYFELPPGASPDPEGLIELGFWIRSDFYRFPDLGHLLNASIASGQWHARSIPSISRSMSCPANGHLSGKSGLNEQSNDSHFQWISLVNMYTNLSSGARIRCEALHLFGNF